MFNNFNLDYIKSFHSENSSLFDLNNIFNSEYSNPRIENFNYLRDNLKSIEGLILPEACPNSVPSWFGFMVTVKDNKKNDLVRYLESNGIQTRMLFGGNIIKQPCFDDIRNSNCYRVVGDLKNTDTVMNNSFWVGVYPGLSKPMLDFIVDKIKKFYEHN